MKRILTIAFIATACLGGLYIYLTWNGDGDPRRMHDRCDETVAQPLAGECYSYAQGVEYYNTALSFILADTDFRALEYVTKALFVLDKLELQEDVLYSQCLDLLYVIQERGDQKSVE